jgi:hypothetical protein
MTNEKQKRIVKTSRRYVYTTRSNWRRWSRDSLKTDQVNLVVKITNVLPDVQLKEVRKQFKHVMRLPIRDLKIALYH